MEEKESPISASPENTESGSPTPISCGVISAPPETIAGDGGFSGGFTGVGSSGNLVGSKKKRGRPRKYDIHGNLNPAYTAKARISKSDVVSPPPGFTLTTSYPTECGSKRGRSKPSPQLASLGGMFAETAGVDFTPHVITVQTGEDVAAKIYSIGQKGPRGVCVLSANGSISSVTIRQAGSSSGLLTYEGRFEILSLSGSYTTSENNGVTSRTGGLSISLASPDGRVVGGSVAGWLTAASPIQVVVGSFVPYGYKAQKRKQQRESPKAAANSGFPDTTPAEMSNAQFAPLGNELGPPEIVPMAAQSHSEADDSIGSGHNLNVVSSHNTPEPEWNNGSQLPQQQQQQQQRIYPDINVSVPGA
ncbi:AT-hook motif nuclear-localized protein 7 [Beta vulgaris subsp. vulgaris]|uniref:AT-hook motif nuclear-localized protein 7 n=1 Tax=Beta vulgaris subsp. vulgaris TaxID=3555 RepID=UPI00203671A7|nr:AT-hook motif nuclear-localized protein 7 [Beta vulgaris subsp. vulgaris]